jgi:PKHD-type hydroxylase
VTYPFFPSPAKFSGSFAYWTGDPLSMENIKRIVDFCETLPKEKASVSGGEAGNALFGYRKSTVAWVPFPQVNPDTQWLYDLLAPLITKINDDFFRFSLYGFMENLQYTVYEGDGGHYDWHVDSVEGNLPPRKLSFSLLLSDPFSFDGGELKLAGISREVLHKQIGKMYVFPSYLSHKVTPVTSGIRRALVGWISGENFR